MTNHPSVGELQAFLDGEGVFEGREAVHRHVGRCEGCGREIADLQAAAALTTGALGLLLPSAAAVESAADVESARWRIRRARAAARGDRLRRAAMIAGTVLVVGAAGWAAAAPGSPLRSVWRQDRPSSSAIVAAPPAVDVPATATVGVPAASGAIAIVFTDVPSGSEVVVTDVGPDESASATAPESSSFSTSEGRLAVRIAAGGGAEVGGAGPLRVALPAGAQAEVSVNGQTLLVRTGGRDAFPGPDPRRTDEGLTFTVGAP